MNFYVKKAFKILIINEKEGEKKKKKEQKKNE